MDYTAPRSPRYHLVAIFAIIIGIPFLIAGMVMIPMFPPIYDAEYTRVQSRLEQIPNTQIIDTWRHEDITLEDFGFTIQVPRCPDVTINFFSVHQSRWYLNFQAIDGVVLVNESQPSQTAITRLSRQELTASQLPIHTIDDVFTHLAPLLDHLSAQPPQPYLSIDGRDAAYVHLSYDGGLCNRK